MEEIFKDIEGIDYQISNLGNVRNSKTGRILKPFINNNGYYRVNVMNNGKKEKYYVHRLVAEAFVENPDKLTIVNHKDENRINNSADNLEWCDLTYNLNYGTAKERKFNTRMKNQGIDEVWSPNLTDKERQTLNRKRYFKKHPEMYEKVKEYQKKYRDEHRKTENWFDIEFDKFNALMEKINNKKIL